MNYKQLRQQMQSNAGRIHALVQGISDEQARWKPTLQDWSILEVINHMYDEEQLDFRVRLDIILHDPGKPWPPINPQGWVSERRYNERLLQASLHSFLHERRISLEWLDKLIEPDWDLEVEAPFGILRAGDMFAAWVAHDLLHTRQLVELHWAYTIQAAQPYDPQYAGEW